MFPENRLKEIEYMLICAGWVKEIIDGNDWYFSPHDENLDEFHKFGRYRIYDAIRIQTLIDCGSKY